MICASALRVSAVICLHVRPWPRACNRTPLWRCLVWILAWSVTSLRRVRIWRPGVWGERYCCNWSLGPGSPKKPCSQSTLQTARLHDPIVRHELENRLYTNACFWHTFRQRIMAQDSQSKMAAVWQKLQPRCFVTDPSRPQMVGQFGGVQKLY